MSSCSEAQTSETQTQSQTHSQSPFPSESPVKSKSKTPSPAQSSAQSSESAKNTVQSVPIAQVPAIPKDPNELLHESLFLDLKPNNYHLDVESFRCQHPVIIEILKRHPIYYALSATACVPHIYLQQVWNTIQYIPEEVNYRFEAFIDEFTTSFELKTFKRILSLPERGDR